MKNILNKYQKRVNQGSDINEHLPILKEYAEQCEHITEMGVRGVVSSYAFLSSNPKKMVSYDFDTHPNVKILIEDAKNAGIDFTYIKADTGKIEIEPTDLLFLDTEHSYDQVKKELELHSNKVKKYIIFHDTVTFGSKGQNGKRGILPAIEEWVIKSPHWVLKKDFKNNNGLQIYKNTLND
tara:strand:+ start:703 stop:1245 length:543 start_codon:yes stop_codon:yes gene_type:complete